MPSNPRSSLRQKRETMPGSNFNLQLLDTKKIAENVAKMSPPKREHLASLSDLSLWETELKGLKERVSHCELVIGLVKPEISQVEGEISDKRKALAHLQEQLNNRLIAADARFYIDDLQEKIARLELQLEVLKRRLTQNERILAGTKQNIEAFHEGHPELEELRKARKFLDQAR
jgi:chromosome segregation ATPase